MAVGGPAGLALVPPAAGIPGLFVAGREVLVGYNIAPVEWHSRLLLGWIDGDWWNILTPEGDVYSEVISGANTDLIGVRLRPFDLSVPVGIDPNTVHDFQVRPGPAALQLLLEEGMAH